MKGITAPDIKKKKTINKDCLKTVERMKGRPGAVPEECGFIHGGLSELQHNVLQRTSQRSQMKETKDGMGMRRFLKN
jgi:hypothetical protein